MSKKIVVVVLLFTLVIGVAGFVYLQSASKSDTKETSITGNDYYKNLDQLPDDSAASLGVNSGNQTDGLGQIYDTGGQQRADGTSTPVGNKTPSNPFDPKTFAQYDKYKDGQFGLFADAQKGTGEELTEGKTAAVLYRGWLTNGQLFDQTRTNEQGQLETFNFVLGKRQVIPGWEQGLAGMKVGGVRLVIVPPAAGYGASGQGNIPPNSVLVFQVQLVDVQ